jgi:ADP-heptose:LPS heptosyltransferase
LPRLLRRSIESFGCGSSGFLVADERRKSAMHASLAKMGRPVVGISWHSSNGESRCVQLDKLISVVRSFNVSVVNLQYGDHTSEIRAVEEHLGRPPFDFSELDCQNDIEGLSALISCCDLVVSIGNSTVHFSGGLGIKTIALLPHFPGWRWLSQGDQSLWYQSVRVLRQHHPGDWSSVLRSLEGELSTRFSRV